MLEKKVQWFSKIAKGSTNAYANFLKCKLTGEINWNFKEFFEFIMEQEDLTKCDYYALYDICQYIIESLAKPEDKKPLVQKLFMKLNTAAQNGNVAAQCTLMILNHSFSLSETLGKSLDSFHRDALASMVKNQKSKNEKYYWSSLFLGIYSHLIAKENKNDKIFKYLETICKNNAVAAHYLTFHTNKLLGNSDKNFSTYEKNLTVLGGYEEKPFHLACLNIFLSMTYIMLLYVKKATYNEDSCSYVLRMFQHFGDFNPGKANYFNAYYYLYRSENRSALSYLTKAYQEGYLEAAQVIKAISTAVKEEESRGAKVSRNILTREVIELSRDFLVKNNNEYAIHLHSQLMTEIPNQEVSASNKNDYFLEAQLFSDILTEIASEKNITTLHIESSHYKIDIQRLLESLEKNTTIHTLTMINTYLEVKDYLKIFHFMSNHTRFENIILENLQIQCPPGQHDKYLKIFNKALFNFLATVKNLKTLKLTELIDNDNDNDLRELLLALQKNGNLRNTKIQLAEYKLNDENLLLLADLLKEHLSHFDLIGQENDFDAKSLNEFTNKLVSSGTKLQHLGLKMLINDSAMDAKLLKSSYALLNDLISKTAIKSLDLTDSLYYMDTNHTVITNLCTNLKKNKTLKALNLSNNSLEDHDLKQIAYVFKHQVILERLILNENKFTHVGLEVFAEVLAHYPNNLKDISFLDSLDEEEGKRYVDGEKVYQAFEKIVSSQYCQLKTLYIPIIDTDKREKAQISFDKLMTVLSLNKTIRFLKFSGNMNNSILKTFLAVLEVNNNIVSLKYFKANHFNLSPEIEADIRNKIEYNLSLNPNITARDNETQPEVLTVTEPVQETNKIEEVIPAKADKNTFIEVLNNSKINYQLNVDEDQNLIIQFDNPNFAQITANVLNSANIKAKLDNECVLVADYTNINQRELKGITYILASNLQKPTLPNPSQKITLLDCLYDLKNITVFEKDTNLSLRLKEIKKFNPELMTGILKAIVKCFKKRKIECALLKNQIDIPSYKEIPQEKIVGIASEIKKLVKEHINTHKPENNKQTYSLIQEKLKDKKIKKQQKKKSEKKSITSLSSIDSLQSQEEENSEEYSMQADSPDEIKPESVTIFLGNEAILLPTEEKFRKLSQKVLQSETNFDSNEKIDRFMRFIFVHHDSLLTIHSLNEDKLKTAYCIFYHAIRISELSNYYIYQHHADNIPLKLSAYGMRTILADRPDYFLPSNADFALSTLYTHPQSYLTTSRQLLLDLFDDEKNLKIKFETGFTNTIFYKDFYTSLPCNKIKLALPDSLSNDVIHVLNNMQAVVNFVQYCLDDMPSEKKLHSGPSISNFDLCALKGAIFLLGHFSRILREYHDDFCRKAFSVSIVKNCFSQSMQTVLGQLFNQETLFSPYFCLLDHINELNNVQILAIAENASFIDHCLMFINARNIMGHKKEDEDDIVEIPICFDEISVSTIVSLCKHFIKEGGFPKQLNEALHFAESMQKEKEQKIEPAKVTLNANPDRLLNPLAPSFFPSSTGPDTSGGASDLEENKTDLQKTV